MSSWITGSTPQPAPAEQLRAKLPHHKRMHFVLLCCNARPFFSDAKAAHANKGARSVLGLTPSQLARKRANDRDAQRAKRAHVKEHIARLKREVEIYYRLYQGRDCLIEELLWRNKALEDERALIIQSMGMMCVARVPCLAIAKTEHSSPLLGQDCACVFGTNSGRLLNNGYSDCVPAIVLADRDMARTQQQ